MRNRNLTVVGLLYRFVVLHMVLGARVCGFDFGWALSLSSTSSNVHGWLFTVLVPFIILK